MAQPVSLNADFMGAFSNKTFEPQRQNNGLVFILGLDQKLKAANFESVATAVPDIASIIALSVDAFPAPKTSNNVIEVPWNNMRIKFAGAMVFDDLELSLKDFIDSGVVKVLNQWRLLAGNPANGAVGLAKDYKLNGCLVKLFGPDSSYPKFYQLDGVWLSRLDCGDVDMNSDDYMRISATLTCDRILPLLALDNKPAHAPMVGAGQAFVNGGGNIPIGP